jgi:hypothetical protein
VGGSSFSYFLNDGNKLPDPVAGAPKLLSVEASGNIFDETTALLEVNLNVAKRAEKPGELVQRWHSWKGNHNLFSPNARLSARHVRDSNILSVISPRLADWRQFWGDAETGSVEGRPRYRGGDVLNLASTRAPEQLRPEDLRLHPRSVGRGAGPDGKDLGADVDLVGPGPAYETWKKTPDYQQWLRDTGQRK